MQAPVPAQTQQPDQEVAMFGVDNNQNMSGDEIYFQERLRKLGRGKQDKPQQLPLWKDLVRAMPNHLARTPLFSPTIKKGKRKYLKDQELPSPEGVRITTDGEQLDQSEADIFMHVLNLAKGHYLPGKPIKTTRYEILKSVGRTTCKRSYERLKQNSKRLIGTIITIETVRMTLSLNLISSWEQDEETGKIDIILNPKLISLFAGNQFSLIDWEKRLQIGKKVSLSKWLQTYAASHSKGEHRVSVNNLKEWCGFEGRERQFLASLKEALQELERLKILEKVEFTQATNGEKQVRWFRS